jgi:hypothetical protein
MTPVYGVKLAGSFTEPVVADTGCVLKNRSVAMRTEPSTTSSFLRQLAGFFVLLFFMSGSDGQNTVQAVFLLLTVSCLAAAEVWPYARRQVLAYFRRHPLLSREISLFVGRWNIGG